MSHGVSSQKIGNSAEQDGVGQLNVVGDIFLEEIYNELAEISLLEVDLGLDDGVFAVLPIVCFPFINFFLELRFISFLWSREFFVGRFDESDDVLQEEDLLLCIQSSRVSGVEGDDPFDEFVGVFPLVIGINLIEVLFRDVVLNLGRKLETGNQLLKIIIYAFVFILKIFLLSPENLSQHFSKQSLVSLFLGASIDNNFFFQ